MKFRPMHDRLLVREIADQSAGGIMLPDNTAGVQRFGLVLAVGDGTRFQTGVMAPVRVAIGQVVMFEHRSGMRVRMSAEEFILLRESEVLGVIEDAPAVPLHAVS